MMYRETKVLPKVFGRTVIFSMFRETIRKLMQVTLGFFFFFFFFFFVFFYFLYVIVFSDFFGSALRKKFSLVN